MKRINGFDARNRTLLIIASIILILLAFGCIRASKTSCVNQCSENGLKKCFNKGYQTCGNYDSDSCLEWSSVNNCPQGLFCQDGQCVKIELKSASILEVPIPKDFYCFLQENGNKPECSRYYKEEWGGDRFLKVLACQAYYNPVCGRDGLFYPSACWAEHLGTSVASYGHCNSLKQFISDMWLTKKQFGNSFYIPSPNIEFSYFGSGLEGWKNGVFLRSTFWRNTTGYSIMDFNIKTNYGEQMSTSTSSHIIFLPVIGNKPKVLLVYLMFDNAYPEQVLLDWTQIYSRLLNDYIRKKQKVSNAIQYDFIPLVINPVGLEGFNNFRDEDKQKIYNLAIQRLNQRDFEVFIVVPVKIRGFGGLYGFWNNMEYIEAPLTPPEPYSTSDKKAGLDALAAFHDMFGTISHEILHAVGLPGDHISMGYGTVYLDILGQNVDKLTGKEKEDVTRCDFLGASPDYYAVELPSNLKIRVSQEPEGFGLIKEESPSGNCLSGLHNNERLKDYDNDGEYEIMYKNNLIGIELQRSLGWIDVDGDNVAEIQDKNAYGGWKEIGDDTKLIEGIWRETVSQTSSKFEPLEEINIDNCKFEKILLEDKTEGLVPLNCAEFNFDIVNLYKDVKYNWQLVQKDYGTVLLPRLN
ncbi:MAG: Kazal-type serine protease inhibitor [Nanoarchaeota archaeon]